MKSLLCATVVAPDTAAAIRAAGACDPATDLVEIRLDALADPDPERLVEACGVPLVLTCRSPRDGGWFPGSERERLDLLRRAVAAGAAWVDVELHAADRLEDRGGSRLIVSHHDAKGTPSDLSRTLDAIRARVPDIAKIVTTATGVEDVLRVVRLLRDAPCPLAAHTMGPAGFAGRILAARFGSAILYGAAGTGGGGVPGQPALRGLVRDYGLDRDLRGAAVILLTGGSLAHSVSPALMNRTFRREGIEAVYLPFPTPDPEELFGSLDELGAVGVAVTIPLKEAAARLVDELDPVARAAAAVNTVYRRDGRLRGTNTDRDGALGAIREKLAGIPGRTAVVVGAGGAARAVAHGLAAEGAHVLVVNRTAERGSRLADEVGGEAGSLADIDPDSVDLLVNATPVGQWPRVAESPVPPEFLRPRMLVMDAVYNPRETRLLAAARKAGCRTIEGVEMLARQGALQLELFLGRPPDHEGLLSEGIAALGERRLTVLLVGMRGAGKTTVGRTLAARLDSAFVDLDAEIEERAGTSIPEIFRVEGEAGFRRRELDALRDAATRPGIVLALGGGTLGTRAARETVAGPRFFAVWLTAPVEVLARRVSGTGRPSLTGRPAAEEVGGVLRERAPVYRSVASAVVDTGEGSVETTVDRILHALGG